MQRESVDASISTLAPHDSIEFIASAEILRELSDFTIAVEEPRRRFHLALHLSEQARHKTLADAAFPARDEDPTPHAVRSSASKTLLSLSRELRDEGAWLVVAFVCRVFAGFAFELLDVVCAISCTDDADSRRLPKCRKL